MEKQKITLQTVDRALELLELMANAGEKLSVVEISKALGTTRTGAYNLLNSLMAKQYVERDAVTNKYHLGYRFLEMSERYWYQYPVTRIIEKRIKEVAAEWEFPVNFAIYKSPGTALYFWPRTAGNHSRMMRKGTVPAHITAAGKMLMTDLSEEQLIQEVDQIELRRYAGGTIVSKDELLREIEICSKQGYALEKEENSDGHGSIACPIRDMSGRIISAVEVGMNIEDFGDHQEKLLKEIQHLCRGISMELGYDPYR